MVTLTEELSSLADELRSDLHPTFGTRPFEVRLVVAVELSRTDESDNRGTRQTIVDWELTPPPKVTEYHDRSITLAEHGWQPAGLRKLSEVSFRYTAHQLMGRAWLNQVDQSAGEALIVRYELIARVPDQSVPYRQSFVPVQEPEPSLKGLGWNIVLSPTIDGRLDDGQWPSNIMMGEA